MKNLVAVTVLSLWLFGCSVTTGILVNVDGKSEALMGEAYASLSQGTFYASDSSGFFCNGDYDQFSTNAMLEVKVSCSDGRTGTARVLRYGENLMNGSGMGKLEDGTEFRILMGEKVHEGSVHNF
ncbi:hypothetical protein CUZ56_01842 [Saezia sanguinis]|uniref:Lipoprotein n=1 Tax=Saezia sanguinis TaxID=1965230 RepID=A0A433SCU3_9BURK|nr:hypothetical protein [Saezia sanguinis]RUS66562.1 hypothetical protein CUZ56_01842 [Saezia sanguinis]